MSLITMGFAGGFEYHKSYFFIKNEKLKFYLETKKNKFKIEPLKIKFEIRVKNETT